jgi:uncharacterized protein
MRKEFIAEQVQIILPIEQIRAYCQSQTIQRLSLFGSVLRNDFSPESDVDMLVDYLPDAVITLLDMAQQEIDLTTIIGHKVDLRTANELSPYFRQDVIETAMLIYERSA